MPLMGISLRILTFVCLGELRLAVRTQRLIQLKVFTKLPSSIRCLFTFRKTFKVVDFRERKKGKRQKPCSDTDNVPSQLMKSPSPVQVDAVPGERP